MSKLSHTIFTIFSNSLMVMCFCFLLSFGFPESDELFIISNNGAPKEMDEEDLWAVLKGERPRWSNGSKVRIALMKPSTRIGTLTAKKIYKMSPNELNKYWLALVFQGRSTPPKFFNYEEDLKKYVKETEGAIGVIMHSSEDLEDHLVYINGKVSIE